MSRLEGETGARAGGGFSPQQTLTLVARAAFPGGKKGPSQYKGSVRSKLCSHELISSPSRADSLLLFPVHSGDTHRLRLVLCHPTCCQRESVFHASDIYFCDTWPALGARCRDSREFRSSPNPTGLVGRRPCCGKRWDDVSSLRAPAAYAEGS